MELMEFFYVGGNVEWIHQPMYLAVMVTLMLQRVNALPVEWIQFCSTVPYGDVDPCNQWLEW